MSDVARDVPIPFAGRYAVKRELGRGGMAPLGTERFLREVTIASRLNHPHIPALHDSGEVDGRLRAALDRLRGTRSREDAGSEIQAP